jgi:hypothetical protein
MIQKMRMQKSMSENNLLTIRETKLLEDSFNKSMHLRDADDIIGGQVPRYSEIRRRKREDISPMHGDVMRA